LVGLFNDYFNLGDSSFINFFSGIVLKPFLPLVGDDGGMGMQKLRFLFLRMKELFYLVLPF